MSRKYGGWNDRCKYVVYDLCFLVSQSGIHFCSFRILVEETSLPEEVLGKKEKTQRLGTFYIIIIWFDSAIILRCFQYHKIYIICKIPFGLANILNIPYEYFGLVLKQFKSAVLHGIYKQGFHSYLFARPGIFHTVDAWKKGAKKDLKCIYCVS